MRGHVGLVEHVARPCDVTCGVAAILFAGWLDRYPDLRLIAANAGGALPLLREKLDLAQRRSQPGGPPVEVDQPVSAALARIYVDTATPSRLALSAAAEVFGPEHLLFGTDSPPLNTPLSEALTMIDQLDVTPEQRDRILGGTARELFGLGGGS